MTTFIIKDDQSSPVVKLSLALDDEGDVTLYAETGGKKQAILWVDHKPDGARIGLHTSIRPGLEYHGFSSFEGRVTLFLANDGDSF